MKTLSPTKADIAFWESFDHIRDYPVPDEWQAELYGYLINGFPPSGFFTAVYANDLFLAAVRSHRSNTWDAISRICRWIINKGPHEAFGSNEKVDAWIKLTNAQRTEILVAKGLLYSEEEVTWNILKKTHRINNLQKP